MRDKYQDSLLINNNNDNNNNMALIDCLSCILNAIFTRSLWFTKKEKNEKETI